MDDFRENGCDGEGGEHTPEAVVLAIVLAAAVNGAETTDEFATGFLDDALSVLHFLGPARRWSAMQDEDDPLRWTVNGIPFVIESNGDGSFVPAVADRTCAACEESVGWRFMDDRGAQAEIECAGCGELLEVDRWWPHAKPVQ